MLTEIKCLLCKHLLRDNEDVFEHKCAAYPKGIPSDVLQDNSEDKKCKVNGYCFELIEKRLNN